VTAPSRPDVLAVLAPHCLDGRTALVTGGGTGIGRACAARLAADGAAVTICGRTESRLVDAAKIIGEAAGHGGSVQYVTADVTDEDSVKAAVDFACEPTGGLDAEIIRSLGALPTDQAALEAERRARLLVRLRAGFQQPEALTDAAFDGWLRQLGVASVSDLVARYADQLMTGALQVQFSEPSSDPPSPRRLPLSAAILVRDRPLDVAQLLADSKLVRDQLDDLGVKPTPDPDSIGRHPVLVIWMIPDVMFDDKDWPGGDGAPSENAARELRRRTAGRWLAREGIGLVTTPMNTS